MIFHFVKSELKEIKGKGRATITDKEAQELEEKGVYLHGEQRKGTAFISFREKYLLHLTSFKC